MHPERGSPHPLHGNMGIVLAVEDNGDQFASSPKLYFEDDEEIDDLEGEENSDGNGEKNMIVVTWIISP